MKIIIVVLMAVTSSVWANDYYNFLVNDSGQSTMYHHTVNLYNFIATNEYEVVSLDKNESLTITSVTFAESSLSNFNKSGPGSFQGNFGPFAINYNVKVVSNGEIWDQVSLEAGESVHGPGVVYVYKHFQYEWTSIQNFTAETSTSYQYDNRWKIRYELNSNKSDPKFSVSLDNDGDRVAMGYKESGSNALIRVYEFDGSSWNQLGEDIE
jgi:hypothetical protein